MRIDHEREGEGVKGSAGKLPVGGNSISTLPKSGLSGFGIDEETIAGRSVAVSGSRASGQNVGAKQGKSSNKGVGIDDDVATGTVSATENFGGYGPAADKRGQFGTSARRGSVQQNDPGSTYGPDARRAGTAASGGGQPGRGGSMELARRGLSGGTSGGGVPSLPRRAANKSLADAGKGLGKGRSDGDD